MKVVVGLVEILSQLYSYPFFLTHLNSNLSSQLHDNLLIQMKKSLVEVMDRLPQSMDRYDGLTRVMNPFSFFYSLFSVEKTISSSRAFLFITE